MKISVLFAALALSGCATQEYALYAETQRAIAESKSRADIARYSAIAEIARGSDSSAKVAAVMSLTLSNGSQAASSNVSAPMSSSETALRWASVLIPSVVQGYGLFQNARVAMNSSDNAAAVSMNTNGTFASISKSAVDGQSSSSSSLAALGTAGFTSLTTLGQSGITGAVTLGQSGNTSLVTLGQSGLTEVSNTGQSGITGAVTLGQSGINGVNHTVDSLVPALPAP